VRPPEPERPSIGHGLIARHAFRLVHRNHHPRRGPPQFVRDVLVARSKTLATVDHEDHEIGLDDRLARLARHLGGDAGGGDRLESAGVDHDESALAHPRLPVQAVAGQPRDVGDQRGATAREPVEQRGLADVGPADQRDDRQQAHSTRNA
jgi:hypothetical protein